MKATRSHTKSPRRNGVLAILGCGTVMVIGSFAQPTNSTTANAGLVQAADIPLRVHRPVVDPDGKTMSFLLANEGAKPALAWAIEFVVRLDNEDTLRYRREDDGFLAADLRGRTMLEPGATRRLTAGLPAGMRVADIEATVTAVIFEDVSAAGSVDIINELMVRREAERDQVARWRERYRTLLSRRVGFSGPVARGSEAGTLRAMSDSVPTADKRSAVLELHGLLQAEPAPSRVALTLKQSVSNLLRGKPGSDGPDEETLAAFALVLDTQYANAVAHTRRLP